jgi:outer membrane protein
VIDQNGVLSTSAVGKSFADRMKQLDAQASAEVQAELTALQTDEKAFEAERATLSSAVANQRGAALQAREAAFQQKYQLRQREMQATGQKQVERINVEVQPIVQSVAAQHGCAILLSQAALLLPAPASMDLTSTVVQQLDGKIQSLTFDREHLDQAGAPAQ